MSVDKKTHQRTCATCDMIARGVKFRKMPRHTCEMRTPTDNHQWVKDESFKTENTSVRGYKTTEKHVCKVCGCEREKTVGPNKYFSFMYSRNGRVFGNNNRPDCIDWNDRESLNRID